MSYNIVFPPMRKLTKPPSIHSLPIHPQVCRKSESLSGSTRQNQTDSSRESWPQSNPPTLWLNSGFQSASCMFSMSCSAVLCTGWVNTSSPASSSSRSCSAIVRLRRSLTRRPFSQMFFQLQSELDRNISEELKNGELSRPNSTTLTLKIQSVKLI